MIRRIIWPLIFGLGGVAILVSLGVWQVQRLAWKEAVLADIEARIAAAPEPLPEVPDPETDRYMPVIAEGVLGDDYVRVLVSQRGQGAQYRVISPLETGDRRIMVDRGVMPTEGSPPGHSGEVVVTGNLHWPDEVDGFTPAPDVARNIWYARDVDALAAQSRHAAYPRDRQRHVGVRCARDAPAGRHWRNSERSPELRGHMVFAGRALDGDDTLSSVAYQAETVDRERRHALRLHQGPGPRTDIRRGRC